MFGIGQLSLKYGEAGNNCLVNGNLKGAIEWYQRAIAQLASEEPEECLECGGKESYWGHIWIGQIMSVEIMMNKSAPTYITPCVRGVTSELNKKIQRH